MLESYVAGSWRTPTDDGAPLLDAATGAEVARISTAPVPAADAVRHAREVGGPALRSMTFHERAMLVKELALALRQHTDELYELSYATGSTAKDTAIDVDGGIVTMLGMSSTARKNLPNDVVATDGAVERISRGGTFLAQHVWTPLRGVAVQVNAYNFPVWGALEKLAPALIAGVPSVVKPASRPRTSPSGWSGWPWRRGSCRKGRCSCSSVRPTACSTPSTRRTCCRSRGPPTPPPCCAPTPRWCSAGSGTPRRRTRSTPRSSAPTRSPARRSSTCSSARSPGR
jgi:oxepin-CoA hydrolase/3-oxo-5,6-dehydrosuberyl-CoA semialdehyde dehydrogenase